MSLDEKISRLAKLLEEVDCSGAESFIRREILPIMSERRCTILEAIEGYADYGEDQDTSFYELALALTRIKKADLEFLK